MMPEVRLCLGSGPQGWMTGASCPSECLRPASLHLAPMVAVVSQSDALRNAALRLSSGVPQEMKVSLPACTLTPNGQKARYGVSYVRNICAQAGFGLTETSPDEDVLATDCDVVFEEGHVRVQVKCTSTLKIGGRRASWPLKEYWIRKWAKSKLPVYFVLVIVPSEHGQWLHHRPSGTLHRTAAFWARIRPDDLSTKIAIPKEQRLSAETLVTWHSDLLEAFTPAVSS